MNFKCFLTETAATWPRLEQAVGFWEPREGPGSRGWTTGPQPPCQQLRQVRLRSLVRVLVASALVTGASAGVAEAVG